MKTQNQLRVNMLIPPPILLLLLAIIAAGIHWLKWGSFKVSLLHLIIGAMIIGLGCLVIYLCGQSFIKEKTPIRPDKTHTISIVTHGLYAYSRNPMYLGMALILIGLSIMLKSPIFVLSALLFIIILHFGVVLREERYLQQINPDEYKAYMKKVPRWL